ncbi:MAG: hypothetical protein QF814_03395 [Candidatus Marinimicrobia bacterium]|jgi:hypothetical protein|nr:hypothetical protein [Candidatus Neomarinimicrobiota bacterium]|tara:strand:+ start:821 stop:964 length:144 start_codon:yes stop_codon:yes gene_type:complete
MEKLAKWNIKIGELDMAFKLVGQSIKLIEKSVYKQFPEIKNISLEID